MRETRFIDQNKKKWTEFEELLDDKRKDPEKLSNLFIKITDDLSYSRTYYPNRSVRVYLNGLAQQLFYNLYKNRKSTFRKFLHFWKEELPQVVYHSRRSFYLSFIVFALAFAIGMISAANDPDFTRSILGDGYVNMTQENIDEGDPMAVYKEVNEVDMFLGITFNNLKVDFLTFVAGVLLGIGSLGILLYNGIMIGCFQFFFVEKGLFLESFLTVWTHGTIEISTIIIAGAAGITLGKGLVFPGTFSRFQAFQLSARTGIKILMGIIPLTILAGFIEGFVTRHTETPDFLRLIFILLCLTFVIGYFVIYPWLLARRGFSKPLHEIKLPPDRSSEIDFSKIKNAGEIFLDAFLFYKYHFKTIFWIAFGVSGLNVCIYYFLLASEFLEPFQQIPNQGLFYLFNYTGWSLNKLPTIGNYLDWPILLGVNVLLFSTIAFFISFLIKRKYEHRSSRTEYAYSFKDVWHFFIRKRFYALVILLIINLVLFIPSGWSVLVFVILFPIFALWIIASHLEKISLFKAFSRTFEIIKGGWFRMYLVYGILGLMSLMLFMLIDSQLAWFYFQTLEWNLGFEGETLNTLVKVFSAFVTLLVVNLIFPLMLSGMAFLYFSQKEVKEANDLNKKISQIGIRKKVYGLERED